MRARSLLLPVVVALGACHGTLSPQWSQAGGGAGVEHLSSASSFDGATLTWDEVPGATRYDVILALSSALTPANVAGLPGGRIVSGVTSPLLLSMLVGGPWYAGVVCLGASGQQTASAVLRLDPVPQGDAGLGPEAEPVWSKTFTPGARFGATLLGAGDTNRDGFGDVLIGAYQWANGQSSEGGLFLFRGNATGLESNYAWHDECDQANANCGTGAAAADFDGDGNIDVVNGGADYKSNFPREGATALFLGTPSGPGLSVKSGYFGGQADANLGRHLGRVGDVNGDGKADLLVPAQGFDTAVGANEGRVWLYLGTASGLSVNAAWTVDGGIAGAGLGWNLSSTPGDVNGDGRDDIVVGSFRASNGNAEEGRVSYFPGGTGLSTTPSWTWEPGETSAMFGYSVALADVNGDGFADLIAGSPGHAAKAGRVLGFFGSATGLSSTPDWDVTGTVAGDALGQSVANAGDVNGDGYDDIVVGLPGFDGLAGADCGEAMLFLGGPLGTTDAVAWTREGLLAGERFGGTVSGAGDVNGDGSHDLIVGIESASEIPQVAGTAELFFGPPAKGPAPDAGAPVSGSANAPIALGAGFSDAAALTTTHTCLLDWGDGAVTTLPACTPTALAAATHVWTTAGTRVVRLRVTNGFGLAGESITSARVVP